MEKKTNRIKPVKVVKPVTVKTKKEEKIPKNTKAFYLLKPTHRNNNRNNDSSIGRPQI